VSDSPDPRKSHGVLERLLTTLEVSAFGMMECSVSPGWRLELSAVDSTTIFYSRSATGELTVGAGPAIALAPHTLVIAPPRRPVQIAVDAGDSASAPRVKEEQWRQSGHCESTHSWIAGSGHGAGQLYCGCFRASYAATLDLFGSLRAPIVEQFSPVDELEDKLRSALMEVKARQIGMGTMTTALLKQVLVSLLRRSLRSTQPWVDWLAVVRDPKIGRAFADMVSRPGAPHTVLSLSQTAGLSRSAFMARFAAVFGDSPLSALRRLRMRQAARLLADGSLSVKQVVHTVGYNSRSSFIRAFRQVYGHDPLNRTTAAQACHHPNAKDGPRRNESGARDRLVNAGAVNLRSYGP
jgi:AraC family transcriptional regulator, activator of mtrCDE